jgi:hypothetical protein
MNDIILEKKIKELETSIQTWAVKNHVWTDCVFKSYQEHFNDEPSEFEACITVLCLGGAMHQVVEGDYGNLSDEFNILLESLGYWYELYSGCICLYTNDDKLNEKFINYFEWKWICNLVEPNYTSLYEELYSYFEVNPERLYDLSSRKMEIFVSEIFRNQGYYTELGKGTNDGGIDLKLYQKDEIDQIVTLVQVKKYKKELPIKLEAVSSLSAIVDQENANRGLFITTSRYLPVAKRFAERQGNRIVLADSNNIVEWCKNVNSRIVRDKSQSLQDDFIISVLKGKDNKGLIGKIVVARTGYSMIMNEFCIILMDSSNVSLLMRLPNSVTNTIDPPYNFRGYEIPDLDGDILKYKTREDVFRAKKSIDEKGGISFWGQQKLFFLWDGQPQYFDLLD